MGLPLRIETPDLIAATAALALAAVIACSWSARRWWIGELTSHWTRHAAWLLLPLAALSLWRNDWALTALAGGFAVLGAVPWLRASRERRAPRTVDAASGFVLVTANLLHSNRDRLAALAAIAACDPAVVVLVEVLRSDEPGLRSNTRWPHQSWHHDDGKYGTAILSSHPLGEAMVVDSRQASIVSLTLDLAGRALRLIAVHPFSPDTPTKTGERNRQLDALAGMVVGEALPVVMAGDFNLTVGNPAWRDLHLRCGLLRHAGTGPATFPARLGRFGIAIDHVLVRDLALGSLAALTIPGSDHRGLVATVGFAGTGRP